MSGFSNVPKILKGAFVEYGISIPPLFVVFQFNPVSISRNRSNTFSAPGEGTKKSLRKFHQKEKYDDLLELRKEQDVEIGSETISFDIRLDATDKLDEGDLITEQFGIAPQLSTLELMMHPKEESLLGPPIAKFLRLPLGYNAPDKKKPPIVLFIWGRKKVLPVNINSMKVNEEEFSTDLNPIRATVGVDLTVIEGKNAPYLYSKAMKEATSVLNLANITDVANVIIPL
jgi:hypothetical protein